MGLISNTVFMISYVIALGVGFEYSCIVLTLGPFGVSRFPGKESSAWIHRVSRLRSSHCCSIPFRERRSHHSLESSKGWEKLTISVISFLIVYICSHEFEGDYCLFASFYYQRTSPSQTYYVLLRTFRTFWRTPSYNVTRIVFQVWCTDCSLS